MAKTGPVPKRSEQRLGNPRSAAGKDDITRLQVSGEVEAPPPGDEWHSIAREWYESLSNSGQSRFFEPSDWSSAWFAAEIMTRTLMATDRLSAQMVLNVWQMMTDLLSTEASRRRVRMEIERIAEQADAPADVPRLDDYRSMGY